MSYLKKALQFPLRRKHKINEKELQDLFELAVAWAREDVSLTQVAHALDTKSNGAVYNHLARGLRYGLQTGKIILK